MLKSVADARGLPLVDHRPRRAPFPGEPVSTARNPQGAARRRTTTGEFAGLKRRLADQGGARRGARPGRIQLRHRRLPVAGGSRLEGPRAHRHGGRPLPRRPSPARRCTGLPENDLCRIHSLTLARQADRQPDRLRRGGRRLHLEDGLRRDTTRPSRRARF